MSILSAFRRPDRRRSDWPATLPEAERSAEADGASTPRAVVEPPGDGARSQPAGAAPEVGAGPRARRGADQSGARRRDRGWAYEVDPAFEGTDVVPREHIIGAWRIDDSGSPTGDFVENPYFRAPPRRSVWVIVLVVVNVLIACGAAVFFVTRDRGDQRGAVVGGQSRAHDSARHTRAASGIAGAPATNRRVPAHVARAGTVRLQIQPIQPVWVCLADKRGRALIDGQTLAPGVAARTYVGSAFRIFLGNGSVRLRINGRLTGVAGTPSPIAYSVTRRGPVELPAGTKSPCA